MDTGNRKNDWARIMASTGLTSFPFIFSVAHFLPQPDSSFPQPLSSGVSVCQEERYHRDEDPQILCNITLLPLVLNKVLSGLGTEDGGCC